MVVVPCFLSVGPTVLGYLLKEMRQMTLAQRKGVLQLKLGYPWIYLKLLDVNEMLDLPSDFRVLTSTITVALTHHGSTTHPSEFYYCCQILPHLRTRANLTAALEQ